MNLSYTEYGNLPVQMRPDRWEKVIGQSEAVEILRVLVKQCHDNKSIPSAFFFGGPTGCGKTTLARLFAKAINCKKPTKDYNPCGKCESCRFMNEEFGGYERMLMSAIEVNCFNHGIEKIRELIRDTLYIPRYRKRIMILEEAHGLVERAQELLLKPTEDSNPTAIWMLLSTDPDSFKDTLKSRLKNIPIAKMTVNDCVTILKNTSKQRNFNFSEELLYEISEAYEGNPRYSLEKLDDLHLLQSDGFDKNSIQNNLSKLLTAPLTDTVLKFLVCLYKNEIREGIMIISKLPDFEIEKFKRMLLKYHKGILCSLMKLPTRHQSSINKLVPKVINPTPNEVQKTHELLFEVFQKPFPSCASKEDILVDLLLKNAKWRNSEN